MSSSIKKYDEEEVQTRGYIHADDYNQVVQVCGNQTKGIDQVPKALEIYYQRKNECPLVLCINSMIVSFVNATLLFSDDDSTNMTDVQIDQSVYICSLRVKLEEKQKGLGTMSIKRIMHEVCNKYNTQMRIHFYATTLAHESAVTTIFKKTGWKRLYTVHQWPSMNTLEKLKQKGINKGNQILKELGLLQIMHRELSNTKSKWKQLYDEHEILNYLKQLRDLYGCCGGTNNINIIAKRYCVDSMIGTSRFIQSQWNEYKSCWVLTHQQLPISLLFIRPIAIDPTCPSHFCDVSAITCDRVGAEKCVEFLNQLEGIGLYSIAFDPIISQKVIHSSPLLSSVETTPYWIHGSVRSGLLS